MEDPNEKPVINDPFEPEKRDFSDLREHLKSLIERIGKLPDVKIISKVTPLEKLAAARSGGKGEGWWSREIRDPKTGKLTGGWEVHVPERILESSENVAKGSAAHEAGHVAITRHHRYIPDKVLQEPGFHQLLCAVEELPTDQVVRDRYPGAGRWLDEVRDEHVKSAATTIKSKKDFGHVPKSLRLSNMIVHGRRIEGSSEAEHYYADIKDVYESIKESLFEAEHAIPEEDADEDEVVVYSKERYKIIYKKIWPEVKKIVEEDIEKEKIRQMLEQAAKAEEKKKKTEKENKEWKSTGELSIDDEVNEALKQMSEELALEMNRALSEASEKREKLREEKNAEESTEEDLPMRGENEEDGEDRLPISIDQLSERLVKALKKAFEKLPKHVQDKLDDMARKRFEALEDEFVKEYGSELVDSGETHEEYHERKEEEKSDKEKEDRRTKTIKISEKEFLDTERKLASMHKTRELYDQVYDEIKELDDKLYRELEEIFTPNVKRTMRLRSAGSKINLPAVFRWESARKAGAGKIDDRIFEQVHLPEKQDYAFTLLNDLSGSMAGEKIEQDFRAKILLAEVLNRLGVKNEILGFQNKVIMFKRFDEVMSDDIRKRMNGILLEPQNENPGGNNHAGVNFDGPCLLEAAKGLEDLPAKEKFLIVVSDGQPTGPSGNPEQELKDAIKKIMTKTDQKLVGLGLGPNTEHVSKFYPTSIPNVTVNELVGTLGTLLKDMIVNPEKYKYNERRSE